MPKKTVVETPAPVEPAAPAQVTTPLVEVAVNGLNASAAAIARVIAEGKNDEGAKAKIRANILHIQHVVGTDLIKNAKVDTKAFTDAVEAGKAFLS